MKHLVFVLLLLSTTAMAQPRSACAPSVACAVALARAAAARDDSEFRDTLIISVAVEAGVVLAQAGQQAEARAAFSDARAGIARLRNRELRLNWTRNLASSLVNAGFIDDALASADRDSDAAERLKIYRAVVSHYARRNRQPEALQAAARAGAEQRDDLVFDGVQTLAEAGRVDDARALATALPDAEQGRVSYLLGVALLQQRDLAGASEAFARVGGSEVYILHQLASAQYATGNVAAAQETMRTAMASAPANGDAFGREMEALVLVRQLTDVEMFTDALAHVSEAPRDNQTQLVAEIAVAQAWAGQAEDAERTFARMMSMDGAIFLREETRAGIASGRAINGEPWRTAFTNVTDPNVRQTALTEAAPMLAADGRAGVAREMLQDAAAAAQRIRPRDDSDAALAEVARAQIESGLLEEARATADTIPGAPARAVARSDVARALHVAGDTDGARAVFADAAETARQDVAARETLWRLPSAMAELGLLSEALTLARALPNDNEDDGFAAATALGRVAEAYARTNDAETAFAIASELDDPQMRSVVYMNIARAMLDDGGAGAR